MGSQNSKGAHLIDKDQEFSQRMDKDVFENECLHNSRDDDIVILANTANIPLKVDN